MLAAILEAGAPAPGVDLSVALGPFAGRIVLVGHDIHSVSAGPFSGQEALLRLLLVPRRPFAQSARTVAPGGAPLGTAAALVAAVEGERARLEKAATRVGGLGRVWTIRFAALKTILEGLPEDVKRVVRLCDGTRDVRTLAAEGPLAPQITLQVLDKLLAAGVLVRADVHDELVNSGDDGDEDDSGGADRRWQNARVSQLPTAAPTPTATPAPATATTTPATTTTTAAPATTAAPGAAPPGPLPTTIPGDDAVMPPPQTAPILLEQRRAVTTVGRQHALPDSPPKPRPELQAWLGDEAAFFEAAELPTTTPPPARWAVWQLAALLAGGAALGIALARACQ